MQALTLTDDEITREGKIFIPKWRREVRPTPNSKGYLRVMVGGKRYFVHRLVAEKFVPNPENKPQVNHIDGNKLNNNADNLEWVTNLENRQHAVANKLQIMGDDCPWSKLSAEDVKFIRSNFNMGRTELAKKFNVSRRTIGDILNYKSWKTI